MVSLFHFVELASVSIHHVHLNLAPVERGSDVVGSHISKLSHRL